MLPLDNNIYIFRFFTSVMDLQKDTISDILYLATVERASKVIFEFGNPPRFETDGRIHNTKLDVLLEHDVETVLRFCLRKDEIARFHKDGAYEKTIFDFGASPKPFSFKVRAYLDPLDSLPALDLLISYK